MDATAARVQSNPQAKAAPRSLVGSRWQPTSQCSLSTRVVLPLEKALSLEVPIEQGIISSFEPGVLEPMQEFNGIALHKHASLAIDLCSLGHIASCRAVHTYTDGSAEMTSEHPGPPY